MIDLKVTEEDLKLIGQALGQMPYYQVAMLVAKLNQQVAEHIASQEA